MLQAQSLLLCASAHGQSCTMCCNTCYLSKASCSDDCFEASVCFPILHFKCFSLTQQSLQESAFYEAAI